MKDAETLYNKAIDYLGDNGGPIDYVEAFSLNAQAAAQSFPDAILNMGWFYFNGLGVPLDLRQAERWYRRSARLGEPKAMFSLGQIAYDKTSFGGARQWFVMAHKHGHKRSPYWLVRLYWRGQGVPCDRVKAMKLFEQAARANDYEATRLMRFINRRKYIPDSKRR